LFAAEALEPRRLLAGQVWFVASANDVAEGTTKQVEVFYIGLDYLNPPTVSYTVGGTATSSGTNKDFEPVSGTVALSSVTYPYAHGFIEIDTHADNVVEGDETVVLTMQPGTGYTIEYGYWNPPSTDPGVWTGTIKDDAPVVTIAATDSTATETATGETADLASFTITRTGGDTGTPIDVSVAFSGTAIKDTDYSASTTVSVGTTNTLNITPIDDSIDEGVETAFVTITDPGISYLLAAPPATAPATNATTQKVDIAEQVFTVQWGTKPVAKEHAWRVATSINEENQAETHFNGDVTESAVNGQQVLTVNLSAVITISPDTAEANRRGNYGHEQRHILLVISKIDALIAQWNGKDTSRAAITALIENIIATDAAHGFNDSPSGLMDPIDNVFPNPTS